MMFVKATDSSTGPRLQINGSDWRVGEVAEQLRSLGVAHELNHEDGTHRSRLIVPVQRQPVRQRKEGAV